MRGFYKILLFLRKGWPFSGLQALGFFALVVFSGLFLDQILIENLSYEGLWKIVFLSRLMTEVGNATFYYVISISVWLGSVIWLKFYNQPKNAIIARNIKGEDSLRWVCAAKDWSGKFFLSLISAAVVIHALKIMVGRLRPYASAGTLGEFNPAVFNPFTLDPDYHSFPSGHSQVVFCAYVAVSSLAKLRHNWLREVFFIFCIWVAFTRVPTHNHYLSDVLVGSLIGFVIAKAYFFEFFRKASNESASEASSDR